jgi:uncharacterized membrane protein YbhN (UPF0104 family)
VPPARLTEILSLLQPAALPVALRRRVRETDLDLDELRKGLADAVDVETPELTQLRRVTVGNIVTLALFALGATILLSSLANVGWDSLVDSLSSASVIGLVAALIVGQTPRLAQALSTIGASPRALPLGPTTLLQLAITFVNLVIPSSAARVATVVRYQQRFGVSATEAVVAGGLDSVAGFTVQAVLLFISFGLGLSSLHLDLDGAGSGAIEALLVFLGLCVVAGLASLLFRKVRRMVVDGLRTALDGLRRLRDPQRLLMLFGGNLLAELLFAVTLGITARAFGFDVALVNLVAINVAVSLVGGLLPIPGGMGVAESGLSLGLIAAGVPEADALAIALSYRAVTFYLPPIWGAAALQWLRRHEYL